MLEQLKQCYAQYAAEAEQAAKEAAPFSGVWGWGADARNDACHTRFYEAVGQWMEVFLRGEPSAEELHKAAEWILCAAAEQGDEQTFWFLYAAQGHCKPLIPLLNKEQRASLRDYYDAHYPKRDRMPVQKEIYKLLRKK